MSFKPRGKTGGEGHEAAPKIGCVSIRFYEELNDFLPEHKRKQRFETVFREGDTVKALIESLGVPHTEVDLVMVNDRSVDFAERLQDGDRVSVYPMFESFDISRLTRVRPVPLRELRFVLDVHLGRLAAALRMLGFDVLYSNSRDDETLAGISSRERRVLLTRDRGLLKRREVTHGYLVRSRTPAEQLAEVARRFDLRDSLKPFTRCLRCNLPLAELPAAEAAGRVPPLVSRLYRRFSRCPRCGRIYWPGTHWEAMRRRIENLEDGPAADAGG